MAGQGRPRASRYHCHVTEPSRAAQQSGCTIPFSVGISTINTNPKRQRGTELVPSLALRVSIGRKRERHSEIPQTAGTGASLPGTSSANSRRRSAPVPGRSALAVGRAERAVRQADHDHGYMVPKPDLSVRLESLTYGELGPPWPTRNRRTGRTDVIPPSFRGTSTGVYARYRLQPVVGTAFMPGGPRLQICLFVWTASVSSPFTGILAHGRPQQGGPSTGLTELSNINRGRFPTTEPGINAGPITG